MAIVYSRVGSNLEDRARGLERAIACLTEVLDALALSPIHETDRWGLTDQPEF